MRGLATSREEADQVAHTYWNCFVPAVPVKGTRLLVVRLDVVTGRRFVLESPKLRARAGRRSGRSGNQWSCS